MCLPNPTSDAQRASLALRATKSTGIGFSLSGAGINRVPHPLQRRFPGSVNPRMPYGTAAMPMLLGSTTVVCTLLSMMLGQIAMSMEAIGVLLAALVLMSVQRE